MKRAVLIVAAVAALLPAAATSASSRIQAVDTTGFPSVRIDQGSMRIGSVVDAPFGVGFVGDSLAEARQWQVV